MATALRKALSSTSREAFVSDLCAGYYLECVAMNILRAIVINLTRSWSLSCRGEKVSTKRRHLK